MINLLRWVVRIAGLAAFLLGLMLSRFPQLELHMALGVAVIGVLVIFAFWALFLKVRVPVALAGVAWAALTLYVAYMPGRSGALNVVHVLLGIGAIGMSEMLGGAISRSGLG